jgi:hypothetical protein
MTTVTAVKTGTLRLRPSHPAGNMNHPVWRRRLAIILDRDWTQPLPIYTYLIKHDEGLILLPTSCRSPMTISMYADTPSFFSPNVWPQLLLIAETSTVRGLQYRGLVRRRSARAGPGERRGPAHVSRR